MSAADYDAELRRLARALSEIAHVLESIDDAKGRIERVLVLTRDVVPYERCALLDAPAGGAPHLFVVPALSSEERERLLRKMARMFGLVADAEQIGRSVAGDRPHLALPVIGLDTVMGVFCVEHGSDFSYDARHLRLVSVVAAQLGAYLTIIRLREAEARRSEELATAHDFQQLLVGIVSHDLRNPLSVITLAASELLQNPRDVQQAKHLERALRNARKANRIISDLLDVTQTRVGGGMAVAKQRVDLVAIVRAVVDDLRLSHPHIELTADATDAFGAWDPDRLSQMATNLIHNALQYGSDGDPVLVSLTTDDDRVRFSVHNSGPPIPADFLDVLFDPFKRGSQRGLRPGSKQGLGLGLYIVDHIVRAHGGEIDACSSAEHGTTFTATLPRRAAEETRASWLPAKPQGSKESGAPKPTVMVVDDDEDVREGIAQILVQGGYAVIEERNGAEALETLRAGSRPRLILLDLMMPVMDGETFCDRCRTDPELATIPIFIISSDVAAAVRLARSRAAGFLTKPVERETLLEAARRVSH